MSESLDSWDGWPARPPPPGLGSDPLPTQPSGPLHLAEKVLPVEAGGVVALQLHLGRGRLQQLRLWDAGDLVIGAFNPVAPKLGQQDEGEGPFSAQDLKEHAAEGHSPRTSVEALRTPPNSDAEPLLPRLRDTRGQPRASEGPRAHTQGPLPPIWMARKFVQVFTDDGMEKTQRNFLAKSNQFFPATLFLPLQAPTQTHTASEDVGVGTGRAGGREAGVWAQTPKGSNGL